MSNGNHWHPPPQWKATLHHLAPSLWASSLDWLVLSSKMSCLSGLKSRLETQASVFISNPSLFTEHRTAFKSDFFPTLFSYHFSCLFISGYCLDGESLDMVCRQIRVEAILYTLVRGKYRMVTDHKRDFQLAHTPDLFYRIKHPFIKLCKVLRLGTEGYWSKLILSSHLWMGLWQ